MRFYKYKNTLSSVSVTLTSSNSKFLKVSAVCSLLFPKDGEAKLWDFGAQLYFKRVILFEKIGKLYISTFIIKKNCAFKSTVNPSLRLIRRAEFLLIGGKKHKKRSSFATSDSLRKRWANRICASYLRQDLSKCGDILLLVSPLFLLNQIT